MHLVSSRLGSLWLARVDVVGVAEEVVVICVVVGFCTRFAIFTVRHIVQYKFLYYVITEKPSYLRVHQNFRD